MNSSEFNKIIPLDLDNLVENNSIRELEIFRDNLSHYVAYLTAKISRKKYEEVGEREQCIISMDKACSLIFNNSCRN